MMRKACIKLMGTTKIACLIAGDLGMGRLLYIIDVSQDLSIIPTQEHWFKALQKCQNKAVELKYEVTRVQGARLAGIER
ncbi:hypothetical protein LVQ78_23415 [Buttiauxella sp. A2-C2_NF]|jgi:hypothetical protein|uniref:hypothetical protein n=1 Tax=Buttiauxella ferragutiae TaxID=82989 RepID=UPI001E4492C5|nr:hypothetical protein [Buttiauxella ferragutiae]MCE0828943.1 hypothetical protein [Buttiauxella ferragutiae]UNK63201.1 hypothetical protein MNO13_09980 [Buttiauxella ferragutiae]